MGKKKEKNTYCLYNESKMEVEWRRSLTESQKDRLIVTLPAWLTCVCIAVIFGVYAYLIYSNVTNEKTFSEEIDMLNEELIINEQNNELYCLIGQYALIKDTKTPHDTIVYEFIKQSGAWYPDILMAQWCLESTYGKSDLAINANNFYGMRIAKSRMTLQEPNKEYKGYGVYRNWQWGVLDRVLWDLHIFDEMPTREEYLRQLGYIYAEDKDYVSKVTNVAKKWKQRDIDQVKKEEVMK